MNSLFEHVTRSRGVGELPLEWMAGPGHGAGAVVSLLEFAPVEPVAEEAAQEGAAPGDDDEQIDREAAERARTVAVMIDAAREEARAELRQSLQAAMETARAEQQARVNRLAAEFARDRQRYFAAAEGQVVRLAMAVARRVLAREVKAGPRHLEFAVKAALGQVQGEAATSLRCAAQEAEAWRELLKAAQPAVDVQADERMAAGEYVLETAIGRIELGVEVQLAEIERGFEELMPGRGV